MHRVVAGRTAKSALFKFQQQTLPMGVAALLSFVRPSYLLVVHCQPPEPLQQLPQVSHGHKAEQCPEQSSGAQTLRILSSTPWSIERDQDSDQDTK
eukprot:3696962-Amphidinium_carterae.1